MLPLTPATWFLLVFWLAAALSLWTFQRLRTPLWMPVLAAAVGASLVLGALRPAGAIALVVLAGACYGWHRTQGRVTRWFLMAVIVLLSLALALHAVPGFDNPKLLDKVQVGTAGAPFSLYLNLDKMAAGILLLGTFAQPANTWGDWRRAASAWPFIVLTPVLVLGAGIALGVVAPDVKWPMFAPLALVLNLFSTCLAEEAFFRGLVQGRLQAALAGSRHGKAVALAVASVLFGVAHIYGGVVFAVLAACAGVGYGLAYQRSGRIETAIATHFVLNATHFVLLTYPAAR